MKAGILVSIARQVEGEYIFTKAIKAHMNSNVLFKYLRENILPQTAQLPVGEQLVDCFVYYGVIEGIDPELVEKAENHKLSFLISIARQLEGEYTFLRAIQAEADVEDIHRFVRENDLPTEALLGEANCFLEYGILQDVVFEV